MAFRLPFRISASQREGQCDELQQRNVLVLEMLFEVLGKLGIVMMQ